MNETEALTELQLATLTRLVDEVGEQKASAELGVGIDSLLRVLARRPNVRRGTIALLQRSLDRVHRAAVDAEKARLLAEAAAADAAKLVR